MNKKSVFTIVLLSVMLFTSCGNKDISSDVSLDISSDISSENELPDGIYTAEFKTDSSMFRVNETCDGKGKLTVKNGEMTIHISLVSKKILNLYLGLAKDAEKEGAEILLPTEDTVTYSDGMTEEVYGFDVPVPYLKKEFDLALVGTKGQWYDHKVSVSNPVPLETNTDNIENGTYSIDITFEGGSGKAEILSPVTINVTDDNITATVQWNSPNYDYMVVDGEKYLPINTDGNSVFEIPVVKFDEPIDVIGDTVAMSKPHEVEYKLTFHLDTIKKEEQTALTYEKSMPLKYAKNFTVDYYKYGYTMLTTMDGTQFLIVPEDKEVPQNNKTVALKRPVKDIYLVASSAMDIFSKLNGLDAITFSGQKEDGWHIEDAKTAMKKGDILYAGKYNRPDYELIASKNCKLAIENMMISHSPEVIEKLESFGIPVMIDYSSYEPHPLGRAEWVKFYGALLGKEDEAQKIFAEQTDIVQKVSTHEKINKTIAFFFITSNGMVQVRQSSDYIPKMIELAGGKYIFDNIGDDKTKRSTINMQIEEFYAGAKDADFLIYNSSIDGGVSNIKELLDKCELLADFKAVKEGNVWCTDNDMYQQSLSTAYLIEDIHTMLKGKNNNMHYLFHLD